MLRLTSRVHIASRQINFVRNYSEGFDLSKYLNRIEAISKTKPAPRQTKPQTRSRTESKPGANGQERTVRARQNNQTQTTQRRPNNNQQQRQPRKPRRQEGTAENEQVQAKQVKPTSALNKSNAVKTTEASQVSASDWSSIEVVEKTRPSSRFARRQSSRKPGSKSKVSSKGKQSGKRASIDAQAQQRAAKATTEYRPFLKPEEALEVIRRNEGTSCGGFIAPIDVSLSALQPNFVESSISYNSRVRSLLNSASAASSQDKEQLERLVNKYVMGSYFELEAGKTLSSHSLASELNANQSIEPHHKRFFAEVASGKITPKQIAARA